MADDTIASIIALHQPKRARTGVQRARAYRPRKRPKAKAAPSPDAESQSSESLIPVDFSSANSASCRIAPHAGPDRQVARRHAVAPRRLHSPGGRGVRARRCRHHHERLVRPIAWVERHRWLAVPGHWRSCRSRRAGFAVMRSRALAHPPARHLSGRVGCMGDDLCLCDHRGHRLRVGQHHRRYGCAGGARNARRDGGPIGVE